MRHLTLIALAAASLCGAQAWAETRKTYIVQLTDEPIASYGGTILGYSATQPAPGTRLNLSSSSATAYSSYLAQQRASVISTISTAKVLHEYRVTFNGFAAQLTDVEVQTLQKNSRVAAVHADEQRTLNTISTGRFLGLSNSGGVWSRSINGLPLKGEDIIIGIVDSGIWPENAAFADKVDAAGRPTHGQGTVVYGPPPVTWKGTCTAAEGFNPLQHCNNKLIGAQFFNAGFAATRTATQPKHWTEFYSARDSVGGATGKGGHGTHTASTAGGNENTPVTVNGNPLGMASGVAPRARIAAYKVCYTFTNPQAADGTGSQNTCFTSDSMAAIDKAVADGVHVINFSISGSQTSVADPVTQAFLRAVNAGVFVAASAGNSGPGNAVAHVSPWVTTVAASTHDRDLRGTVTLGDNRSFSGASSSPSALPSAPLIRAADAAAAGATAEDVRLCIVKTPSVLDPVKVAGKIVVCDRGVNARVDKSQAVKNAGGIGMVLADNGQGLVADFHAVPTVHVNLADGNAIRDYAAAAGATAAISQFFIGSKAAPVMAGFSSRGPNRGDANMLKPDLTAPGVDVIAGTTAALTEAQRDMVANGTLVPGANWESYQGTSMSSPHVAGLGALLRQAYPNWSPMAIKSALMTTTYSTLNDGLAGLQNGRLPWAQGTGHVDPIRSLDPGLVYDAGRIDFIRYQCLVNRPAVVPASDCTTHGTLDSTLNHNLASLSAGAAGNVTIINRKVTHVGSGPATYTAAASVPGFNVTVTPSTLNFAPGETKSFSVRLDKTTAVQDVWNYGSLSWSDGMRTVRSPLTVRAGASLSTPQRALSGNKPKDSRIVTIAPNYTGTMSSTRVGMKPVTLSEAKTLAPNSAPTQAQLRTTCNSGTSTANVQVYTFNVAAGTLAARFSLRQEDTSAPGDDNDLMVILPGNTSFVHSLNDFTNETIELRNPAAGTYRVCVHAWGGAPAMTHRLSSWIVSATEPAANLVANSLNVLLPSSVRADVNASVGVAWNNLPMGNRYYGAVQLRDNNSLVSETLTVFVDTSGTAPASSAEKTPDTPVLRN